MLGNLLIDVLPPSLQERVASSLEIVSLDRGESLMEKGKPIAFVYFPTTALVSVVVTLADGTQVESATVGRDGFLGLPALFGSATATNDAFVQVAGEALRIELSQFMGLRSEAGFSDILGRYALLTMVVSAQSAACFAFHPVAERLARWLLMVRDGIGRDEFPLTQDFIAIMIGSQRPTVSIAIRTLEVAGLIARRRGLIRIVDGEGLATAACECYQVSRSRLSFSLPGQ